MKGPLAEFKRDTIVGRDRRAARDQRITTYTVTNQVIKADIEMTPEREAQAQKLSEYWAKKIEEELMRQLLGSPSEYEHSLRAAGIQV
ncbi:hypothetical protein [Bradyrhizobium sp. th.b2]|uniref:hypothetical protein n=1 Tax=Bradyrhizobium sp. th-b2 TaxID=172088 RepID=UPI000413A9C7|nr:hypothetical protein [Bradyrhizobium sp. th.b2]